MKRLKFSDYFLLAAVIMWIAAERNAYSSILLILASAFEIVTVVPQLWKEWKHADRDS